MKKLFIILLFLLLPSLAFAGTYYVSPTGSGSTCSEGSPCSVSYAMANAVASDIWIFQDGTYNLGEDNGNGEPILYPSHNGSSGTGEGDGYITFKAENMLAVTLNGQVRSSAVICNIYGAWGQDYVIWDGFKSTASPNASGYDLSGISIRNNSSNIIVRNFEAVGGTHDTGGGINYEGIAIRYGYNITIQNGYIHDYIETSNNHNTTGFKAYPSDTVTIDHCTFIHNVEHIYGKEYAANYIISNNFFLNATGTEDLLWMTRTGGDAGYVYIYGNVFGGGHRAISLNEADEPYQVNDAQIYNNTMWGYNTRAFASARDVDSFQAWNNIAVADASDDTQYQEYQEVTLSYLDYNSYYGSQRFQTHAQSAPTTTYTSLTSWASSSELDANNGCNSNDNPDECSYYQGPALSNTTEANSADDFRLTNDTPSTIKSGGRGGSYASYMGAWNPNSQMWVGFCAQDRYPSNVGNCDVYGNADYGGGDLNPPVVTIDNSNPTNLTSDSLTITGNGTDADGTISTCKARIGGEPNDSNGTTMTADNAPYDSQSEDFTGSSFSGFSEGANTLYIECKDNSSNWSSGNSIVVNLDTTPPTVSTKEIQINGTHLYITFSESVTINNSTGFSLSGTDNSVDIASCNTESSPMDCTLDGTIYSNDTGITLNYSGAPADAIQDSFGLDLADFSGQAVTNSSTQTQIQSEPSGSGVAGGGASYN